MFLAYTTTVVSSNENIVLTSNVSISMISMKILYMCGAKKKLREEKKFQKEIQKRNSKRNFKNVSSLYHHCNLQKKIVC